MVVTVHDLIPLTHYGPNLPARQRAFYRWNLSRALKAAALITVSHQAMAEIVRETRTDPNRLFVAYNGMDFAPNPDLSALHRLGIEAPYILYAGSYEPRKNLKRALSAYARLVAAGITERLVAIVEPASGYRSEALRVMDGLGLGDRVTFVHSLTDDDLRALYTRAQVLFFPSIAEGFGYPPLQAAACGVPVVASDLPVLREVLDQSAVFVDPFNEDDMAATLTAVLTDMRLRARLSQIGPSQAAKFSLEATARRHLQIYRGVAGARAARDTTGYANRSVS
jgi:glycosyltransferase involved in cell wall biosynthesis